MKRFASGIVLCAVCLAHAAVCFSSGIPAVEKARLDTFFSAFAETNIQSFDSKSLNDEMMLYFAEWNLAFHPGRSLKKMHNGSEAQAPSELIDTVTETYFGKKIAKHTANQYTIDLATGEVDVFAQVDKLVPLGDDRFEAHGTVYYVRSGVKLDTHADPGTWKKQGIRVRSNATFAAIIQHVGPGEGRYIMLEYTYTPTM